MYVSEGKSTWKREKRLDIRRETIEGIILANERSQMERTDVSMTIYVDSIEVLERFYKMAREMDQEQNLKSIEGRVR